MGGLEVMITPTTLHLHIRRTHHESVKLSLTSRVNRDSKELLDKPGDQASGLVWLVEELLATWPVREEIRKDERATKDTVLVASTGAPIIMDEMTMPGKVHLLEAVDTQAPVLVEQVIDEIGVK